MITNAAIEDLSILSRNHLLAEAERMERKLESLKIAVEAVCHEVHYGAPASVALSMLRSALMSAESIE